MQTSSYCPGAKWTVVQPEAPGTTPWPASVPLGLDASPRRPASWVVAAPPGGGGPRGGEYGRGRRNRAGVGLRPRVGRNETETGGKGAGGRRQVVGKRGSFGQGPRGHQRQGGGLRPCNRNGAVELAAADNTNAVHTQNLLLCKNYRAERLWQKREYLRLFDGMAWT